MIKDLKVNKKLFFTTILLASSLLAKNIEFEEMEKNPQRVNPNVDTLPLQMFDDPFFKKFFGEEFSNQFKQNRVQRSLGSGVIVTKDGYIVTNNHVIENAEEINVTIGDDPTEYSALLVGDVTFAIGNPFRVGNTVTMGIISALNKNRVGINRYENYIQTDASINPGNSGGALVDSRGALIGINTAILSKSGGNDGIGFAIPVEMVKDVVGKLVSDGKVIRGYLGVVIVDLDKDSQQVYKRKEGAIILDISNDTPAAKYGLKRGDLVYAINGKETKDRVVEIVLDDRSIISGVQPDSDHTILNGLKVSPINAEIIKKYRLPLESMGILITDVEPKSKAERSGFLAGDIIIQIEDVEIKNYSNIETALKRYNNQHKRVYINRYGQTLMFIIQ